MGKVLITQSIDDEVLQQLSAHCAVETLQSGSFCDALPDEQLLGCTGLICFLTDAVTAALVQRMENLEFVSSVSVGLDHIDLPALNARGIPVGHTPGVLVDATADLAMALLLAAARRVVEGDRFVRAGCWCPENHWSPDFFLGRNISGATLGIVGLGAIGQAVARRAAAFNMDLIGWTPSGRVVPGVQGVSLEELLVRSDCVSLHVALTDATRNLIDAARINSMKPGAVLINTARGEIVDEQALAQALDGGQLFAAGLDVFASEPLSPESPLLRHPRVVLTPHIGSATAATRAQMLALAMSNAVAALQGRRMPHCANARVYDRAPSG
ncbi:MAG: D-glycerate dehydrogenase [Halioglobus sp.]|nr:D-glycerate dehydrogenase [Halioglobus sp.]